MKKSMTIDFIIAIFYSYREWDRKNKEPLTIYDVVVLTH